MPGKGELLVHIVDELLPGDGVRPERTEERLREFRPARIKPLARPPLVLRLENDDGLHHREWSRIGGCLGPSGLSEYPLHLRELLQNPVLTLQQCTGLGDRDSRQSGRHVEDRPLVERRHELAAEFSIRRNGRQNEQHGDHDDEPRPPQNQVDSGGVDAMQDLRDRMLLFRMDRSHRYTVHQTRQPPRLEVVLLHADEDHHQRRREGDREYSGDGHGEVFREGQRLEQPSLLRLQGKNRQEGQGDHEQGEEARPSDLLDRFDQYFAIVALRAFRLPSLELLVRVLDDDDRRINESANRDRDSAERHDVRVDPENVHGNERQNYRRRKRDDRDHRAGQVPQEDENDERDDQHFDHQLVLERADRLLDQFRAVVRGDDLYALREGLLDLRESGFDAFDNRKSILAMAHHDRSRRHLSLSVEVGYAATHLGAELHGRDVAQAHWRSHVVGPDDDLLEVLDLLDVPAGPDHVLGAAELEQPSADFVVRGPNGLHHLHQRDSERCEAIRINSDLVLADEATQGCHLRYSWHRLQLVTNRPVLKRPQIGERVFAAPVHQCVLEHPADTRRVGPELCLHSFGKLRLDLREVLEDAAARPVEVRPFLEDDVDVREAEIRETADRLYLRSAEKRGDDRVGDLVLDDVGAAVPLRINDDLRVRKVRQRIDRDPLDAPGARQEKRGRECEDDEFVRRAGAYEFFDHCWFPLAVTVRGRCEPPARSSVQARL